MMILLSELQHNIHCEKYAITMMFNVRKKNLLCNILHQHNSYCMMNRTQ